ncbi:hypothetical protein [Undibacterium sp. Di24W]
MKPTPRIRQVLVSLFTIAILILVFLAYLQPTFIVDLANRYVFC